MKIDQKSLDRFDHAILAELAKNGRLAVTELAQIIGLSKSPTQARLKALEGRRIIAGYRASIDPIKMGLDHVAFVEVHLSDTREKALQAFNKAVQTIPEIEQCHMIASNFDYLMKVRTRNIQEYRRIMGETLSSLPFVASTSTFVAMEAVKEVF
ncbi:MAG: Lrp/AsnC ligand binding domain-containing protein [Proteobacteria bacterium]|nr:Lrp/AsnC ligand binding domain-containing protein [Pseudomonadota bacterium]